MFYLLYLSCIVEFIEGNKQNFRSRLASTPCIGLFLSFRTNFEYTGIKDIHSLQNETSPNTISQIITRRWPVKVKQLPRSEPLSRIFFFLRDLPLINKTGQAKTP